MIAIPNMSKPKHCTECYFVCRDQCELQDNSYDYETFKEQRKHCPLIEIDDEAIDIAQDIMDGCKELKERVDKGIVRCGECKHYNYDTIFKQGWCRGQDRKPTDFCSYGERRADEHNTKRD